MVFPVDVYGCESWTIKKGEPKEFILFDPWCWRRLSRVPWTARRSNQSILKEISLEYSLEGLMLKLQYFGHLMQRADSLEKRLMLGKIEGRRRRGQPTEDEMVGWHHWLNGHEFEQASGDGEGQLSMGWQRVRHNWATEQQQQSYYGKEPACQGQETWDMGLIPGSGRSSGEGDGRRKLQNPWTEEPGGL